MRMKGKKVIFNEEDCWSMDETLSPVIHAGLVKFKEELLESDYQRHPMDFCDETGEGSEEGFNKWIETIDKMIYAFDKSHEPVIEKYQFDFKSGHLGFLEIDGEEEYTRYTVDMKIWEEKCEEGRELFAKYFQNLWI